MISTGFDSRVKIQHIIENQLPEFITTDNPKVSEFLKQYYISQEFQGGSIDIAENLDQYIKLDNLTPEIISGICTVRQNIGITDSTIRVNNTKGFPSQYGLLKIDSEIITYTGITTNSFTGCVRGFSGIVNYQSSSDPEEIEFSTSKASSHISGTIVQNLSTLFLKEFYKKLKISLAPGFEDVDFVSELNVNNFIKEIRSFYQTKGTSESFKILYKVLYGIDPTILNLEEFLIKPSDAEFIRREVIVAELISGTNPNKLVGQVIRNYNNTASAPVSEVEIIKRGYKNYYKLQLFAGHNEKSLIEGTFEITPKTKVIDLVPVGSTVITVDSTIGFSKSGILVCGNNLIKYTDKSVNQFFGCSGIENIINSGTDIRSEEIIYGYEDGDVNRRVDLRITGVISNLKNQNKVYFRNINDNIFVKHIGDKIKNPQNKNYKEFIFNSWIYNTSSRYEVSSFSNNILSLYEEPDKSSLKLGDSVNVLDANSENIIISDAIVTNIANNVITLNKNIIGIRPDRKISIRRNLNYAQSSTLQLEYPKITSDIQNTYNDSDQFIYAASNSLPSFNISKTIIFKNITIDSTSNLDQIFSGYSDVSEKYSILSFDTEVPFITGDAVVYTSSGSPIDGLILNKVYYIQVLETSNISDIKNKIRLYPSRSFINTNNYIEFKKTPQSAIHTFTLESQSGTKKLSSKKILRKFPLNQNIQSGTRDETKPGPIGMLINGVEIINYKSEDKIYYGPLDSIKILNPGLGYDVINPPSIVVSNPSVSTGITALINPIIKGKLEKVLIDPNEVNIQRILSLSLTGGNGSGAILEPIIEKKFRELSFNGLPSSIGGGGVDVSYETITFLDSHLLSDGTPIVYNENGNKPLGIGNYFGSNTDQNKFLSNGSIYYPEIVNSKSIKLYNSLSDLNSGINTIGFTTTNTGGVHKFRLLEGKNVLTDIRVIDGGSNYENRSLKIKPSGISTVFSTINFNNHGFNDGDLINYRVEVGFGYTYSQPISGLSTANNYYVLKIDNSSFRLADAGPINSSPTKTNFNRGKYVNLLSNGDGQQIFEYPPIKLNLEIEYSGSISTITATPIVKGKIVDAYLYEPGTDYGSSILNFHKRPIVTLKNGNSAQLRPIIKNGSIVSVDVQNGGKSYTSNPNIIINGDGLGAVLRPVVSNGRIVDVIVIKSGSNYNENNTSIRVEPSGRNALLSVDVRSLTVNNQKRFSNEILMQNNENLSYGIVGYSTDREGVYFSDSTGTDQHSKVIGWAYDGNPIYGPYGYSNPSDNNSTIVRLNSGYTASLTNVYNRPNKFDLGFFVEDYKYTNSGDLDICNGRFSKTPDFPNGIYAYYVGLSTDNLSGKLISQFPYFIGNFYRSEYVEDIKENQDFDFNNSNLIRNTFPYRINQSYSNNDFILEPNKTNKQLASVELVSEGSIESLSIINPGNNYKVGESIVFDNTNTQGSGSSAIISEILGKQIVDVQTSSQIYENVSIARKNLDEVEVKIEPYHNLLDGDIVQISGISTSTIKNLNNSHKIGVSSIYSTLVYDLPLNLTSGVISDIYVSPYPSGVKVGSIISIGTELLSILNVFPNENILRVSRGVSNVTHPAKTRINFYPNSFTINLKTDYFDSKINEKVYFNPVKSIGVGTLSGGYSNITDSLGTEIKNFSVQTQSIYLPNHPFQNNQKVLFFQPNESDPIIVRNTPNSNSFFLPNNQYVYIINKNKDFVGIVTQIGLTTTTNGLYFTGNGSDTNLYYFKTNYNQITANVKKITSQVSVSTYHELKYGDEINLTVKPNLPVGIGTNTSVVIKYNSTYNKLLANPIGINSTRIDTSSNKIFVPSHNLQSGQKVFYDSLDLVCSGLQTGSYFVHRVDDNYIQLSETFNDVMSLPPKIVSIGSSGGKLQEISLINPQIKVIKNNDLVFDVSHSSLVGYNFKIFFDSDQKNEFISIGDTSQFSLVKQGIIGISSSAKITIGFNTSIPTNLYYNLEKNGNLVLVDSDVKNNSNILYLDSIYTGKYKIFGVGSTTFNITLNDIPEKYSYQQSDCNVLNYTTNSKTAKGGISNIDLISGGFNYASLPYSIKITPLSSGSDAIIKASSNNIGKIEQLRIINEGFEYASDKTLKPKADIPRLVKLQNSEKITKVDVIFGGKNFISPPLLVLVNGNKNSKVSSGLLKPQMSASAIVDVQIISEPKGLESLNHTIFCEKNSNGVRVERILSYEDGIVTCQLSTPAVDGFVIPPFSIGDYIFVEGIKKQVFINDIGVASSPGTGFNSADNGYKFFEVVNFINSNPAILSYDIGKYTKNAGTPIIVQNSFNSIVNRKNYPIFKITQSQSIFLPGESLLVNNRATDLIVESFQNNYLKITGEYKVFYGDLISGVKSGNVATVDDDIQISEEFNVSYSNKKNYGWKTDIGKLNNSLQVLQDNDYYQNLSYSIKTTGENYKNNKVIGFEKISNSINRLVHPTGIKNFADVGITSSAILGIGSDQSLNQILDFVSEKRVDTFNNFDLALDYDPTVDSSERIILKNRKLTDYIECVSNRVLQIDDISGKFSSKEFNRDKFVEVYEYSVTDYFSKFLVQVSDEEKRSVQTSELIVLNNFKNTYTLNKSDLYTGNDLLANLSGDFADNGNMVLRFDPVNPFDVNYNIKIYRDYFSSSLINIGVGYTEIGFLRLNGRIETLPGKNLNSNLGVTTDVFRAQFSSINSVYANVFIMNEATLDMNYFEVLAHHDGEKGYVSEYYFDTENNISGSSFGFIGTFGIDVENNVLKLNFTNDTNNPITIRAKTVGFGSTSSGIGTYRFLVEDQDPGSEKSARLESSYQVSIGSTIITSYPLGYEATLKSLVRVGVGSTVALHQFLVVSDQQNVSIQQYPFLSVGTPSKTGIGTFGATIENQNVIVRFYPDSFYELDKIEIKKFNQFIYFDIDEFNVPNSLTYGIGIERLETSFYGALNTFGKDRLSFDLNYENIPIFEKTFNPNRSNILNKETGVFTIANHFFQTGEELIYTPGSTLLEEPAPLGIGTTLVGGSLFEGDFIVGFSTITGVKSKSGISTGSLIIGDSVPPNTTITSIGSTYTYFVGNVVSGGSSIITGIANTSILSVGSGIYSGNNSQLGTITSIGINSITSSTIISGGLDRVYYSSDLNFAISLSQTSTASTSRSSYYTGIITDICPSRVYAIKIDNDNFKLTGLYGKSGIGFTFTSPGVGNFHRLEMKKKNEKSLITVNGVNQYPLIWTPVKHDLKYNGGSIGAGISFIALSGISSISPRDLLKIDEEYVTVVNVGFGTTNTGPVTGLGTIPIVEVYRGYVGTSATTHLDGSEARIYKGSYNIVRNKIHFTEAPDGKGNNDRLDASGLPLPKSTFNGRVFLRRDYEFNKIYDDISNQFTGIGRTFNLTLEGKNTSGIETGSGIVFINDVFQTPDTENNEGNNYKFSSSELVGITTITFTSVTRPNTNDVIIVPYDVNQNQVPRGGIVVSLGSTGGLGYAPLVGASVTAVVGVGGSIVSVGIGSTDIVGSGYRNPVSIGITDSTGSGANIIVNVGAGGSLAFKVLDGGSNYTNPIIKIDDPSYQNLSIEGISRLSIGNTTKTGIGLSMTIEVDSLDTKIISGRNADASRLIRLNKQLIAEVAVGRMLSQYTSFNIPGGNQKCINDILLILDSLAHNLEYGGNDRIYDATKLYIDNSYLSGEESESIYAYHEVRDLAIQIMRNDPIDAGGYSSLSQYFDNGIEGDISGSPGIYNSGDCSDIASAITQFVGIITTGIGLNTLPQNKIKSNASLFGVKSFAITTPGYSFERGDKFRVVGLVTDASLEKPIEELIFTVDDILTDTFACVQLGELDYIDSIKSRQNGIRTRFPLFRNNQLLSFQKNRSNPESVLIDFNTVLLIYLNGVMQEPGVSYTFDGGTTFTFKEPPRPEDNVAIFFYRGTRDVDSTLINVNETVKPGDILKIDKNNQIINTIAQDERVISFIESSDVIQTGIYLGDGIDSVNYRPINWTKQKKDLIVNETIESKARDSIEPLIFPAAKIIKNVSSNDKEIFLDSAQLFNYEENQSVIEINNFQGFMMPTYDDPIPAKFSTNVSSASTISSITIIDGGSGYIPNSTLDLKISNPKTTNIIVQASANATVSSAGSISSVNITNSGFGYTNTNPPKVICASPTFDAELIPEIKFVEGFSGIITGITTSVGTNSNPLSLVFYVKYDESSNIDSLKVNYPILVSETTIGNGVTSINMSDNEVIGIGTNFLDNIYYISSISRDDLVGVIQCNIASSSDIIGISTFGDFCGRFSWGRLSGITRASNSLSIGVNGYTINSGLTTFPQIIRRGYGLRDTGALRKSLPFEET